MEVCTVTDTYECGNSYLVSWDVYRGMRLLYSVSFHWNNLIGTNYTASINNITIYTELTDVNSTTNIYSILTVNHNIIISGVSVFCNREETFPIFGEYNNFCSRYCLLITSSQSFYIAGNIYLLLIDRIIVVRPLII